MTFVDHLTAPDLSGYSSADGPSPPALEQAEQLIADLTVLVDAGLVVAHRQLGGPLRYGAVADPGDAEQ